VKVLVRRSLYFRSLTGLLKFGPGARVSSIHVPFPLSACHELVRKGKPSNFFFKKRGKETA
jgi:hypothetical protein